MQAGVMQGQLANVGASPPQQGIFGDLLKGSGALAQGLQSDVADKIDFRVSDRLANGHDPLNVIIFRKRGKHWQAVSFIYSMKKALIRTLREG